MTEDERSEKEVILDVKNLHTYFYGREKDVVWKILEGINFKIHKGETLGILGPSGAGKSVLALSILRLIDFPGKIEAGEIFYKENDLLKITNEQKFHL
ncbi:MAG: ATP-binding cassette domain-containing protein [Candidatus Heimdallarchaeota archaeon]